MMTHGRQTGNSNCRWRAKASGQIGNSSCRWPGIIVVVHHGRLEGLLEGVLCLAKLLIDKHSADVVLLGELRDGLFSKGIENELLSCRWGSKREGVGSSDVTPSVFGLD